MKMPGKKLLESQPEPSAQTLRLKTGNYQKGLETASKILDAAEQILIESGYKSLSFRRVAREAGITAGNLQYYFPTKDDLIKALLDKIIQVYLDDLEVLRHRAGNDPHEQLAAVLTHVITDLNEKKTTHFFPEVWALANHENQVSEMVDDMYAKYRSIVQEIVQEMNPELSKSQARKITLFMTASIEGHTIFIGHHKHWTKDTRDIIRFAIHAFNYLIHNPDC